MIASYDSFMTGLFAFERPSGFARVAVERGIDRYPDGLTYAIPAPLDDLRAGERVRVPLGRGDGRATGYVVEILRDTEIDPTTVKTIEDRDGA